MSKPVRTSRWLALKLAELARSIVSAPRAPWVAAMRNEMDYMEDDRQALAWAAGCLRATIAERLQTVRFPDSPGVRILMALPLALLTFNDLFAPALTAAYWSGAFPIARGMGEFTPGDDYRRLIPLMENLPLWLHGLVVSAAVLYAFTVVRLVSNKQVSWIPVMLAAALEITAEWLGRPIIDAIGVAANPNPPIVVALVPFVLPFALALYLWKMKRTSYA